MKSHSKNMSLLRCCALVIAACALTACAQPRNAGTASAGEPSLEQRFQRLDLNADGFITWEEAVPSRESDFISMDRNKDDALSPDEFRAARPFSDFDGNSDGTLSKAEFLATHRAMFLKFDADKDQRISVSEFATAQRAARK